MKWKKYAIATVASAEDVIVAVLNELDITAIEIADYKSVPEAEENEGGYYEELQPDLPESDEARVIFYLDEDADDAALLAAIRKELKDLRDRMDIGEGTIEISVTDEADWRDKWKEYFHAFTIGDIRIRPSWEAPEKEKYPVEIVVDPGISFGTGQHETTRMCIEALSENVTAQSRVLDIGCGSGILSVAALKLHAASFAVTDIDAACMESVRRNFAMNDLPVSDLKFYVGDLTKDAALQEQVGERCYDVVVANILADIIIGMLPQMQRALAPDGVLILSGIIDFKENAVREAVAAAGFTFVDVRHDGEWVCILARRKEAAQI